MTPGNAEKRTDCKWYRRFYFSSGGSLNSPMRILCACTIAQSQHCLVVASSLEAYRWQLGDDDRYRRHAVDDEKGQVVVGIMCADEEERDGHYQQELLGGRVLVAVVNLLPHVEVVVGSGVEVEG